MKALLLALVVPSAFAQVPVSITMNAPGMGWHMEDTAKYVSMLQQARQTYGMVSSTYSALSGITSIGTFLRSPLLFRAMPTEWTGMYSAAAFGNWSSGMGALDSAMRLEQASMGNTPSAAMASIRARQEQAALWNSTMGNNPYSAALARTLYLDALTQQVNVASTMKQSSDLNARIAGENANVANEQTKILLMQSRQMAEQQLIDRQKMLVHDRVMSTSNNTVPSL